MKKAVKDAEATIKAAQDAKVIAEQERNKKEQEVKKLLGAKGTPNSGAMFNDADLSDDKFIIECKVKNTRKTFSVPAKEITKLKKQANFRSLKTRRDIGLTMSRLIHGGFKFELHHLRSS